IVSPALDKVSQYPTIIEPKASVVIDKNIEAATINDEVPKLRDGAMRMLKAIAMFHPNGITRERAKTLTGISSPTTFSTYKQELLRLDWIKENGDLHFVTDTGLKAAGNIEPLPYK